MREHYVKERKGLDELAVRDHNRTPLRPQFVAKTVDEIADADAVFLADVGTPVVWAARYLHMNGKRRLIGSFNHGTMANAVPQAIGVQAAQPGRQVVAFSGDGGLAMLLGELITLRQLKLPVKIVVFNNGALSFVELEMKTSGLVNFGTDLEDRISPRWRPLSDCTVAEWIGQMTWPMPSKWHSSTRARGWSRSCQRSRNCRSHQPSASKR